MRSNHFMAFKAIWNYFAWDLTEIISLLPIKPVKRFRVYTTVTDRVAKTFVDKTQSESRRRESRKDVMSILSMDSFRIILSDPMS